MMPVLGALMLQAAYGAVDLLVVGRFGSTSGLSAVSTGSQVLNLVTFVVMQFAMGITVLIARYLGEKKPEQIGAVIGGCRGGVCHYLCGSVYFDGRICTTHFRADAGSGGSRWILPQPMSASAEAVSFLLWLITCWPPSSVV